MIGPHSSVQGQFFARLPDGRVIVRVGAQLYTGRPVSRLPQEMAAFA
jgi:hypothetical protein